MQWWQWVLWIYMIVSLGYWLGQAYMAHLTIHSLPVLARIVTPEPSHWPKVSAIVPAHNEGDVIEGAVTSRLQDDYPNLEIVLIDDRSTDETVQIVPELGRRDSRIIPVRIDSVPDGWWGKTNALNQGLAKASGDWILMSDADVHVKPGTMRRAIAYCEAHRIDHLTVLPEVDPAGFWMDAAFGINIRQICNNGRVWAVADPESSASSGMGAFSLIRRSVWNMTPGIEAIKLDVTEDYAIGRMLKQSGARCAIASGFGCVGLQFYRSVSRYAVSMNRSGWAYWGKFSLLRIIGLAIGLLTIEAFPAIMLIPMGLPYQPLIAAAALALCLGPSMAINWWNSHRVLRCLLFPVGAALNAYLLLQSGLLGLVRGGVTWGGIFVPNHVLKANAHV